MAGHSHFKNIKRKKEAKDAKKATEFSKISQLLISAVREKGKDPKTNPNLRTIIEKAKEVGMPKESIKRALRKGAGEEKSSSLESFLVEVYGPEGVAFLIQGSTDNKNKDLGEIKEVLKRNDGKLAEPGSVKWLFEPKSILKTKKEKIMLKAIEKGIEDIEEREGLFFVYASPEKTKELKKVSQEEASVVLGWKAISEVPASGNKYKKLFRKLKKLQAVEEVYINTKI